MKTSALAAVLCSAALVAGCAEMGAFGGPRYGDTSGTVASQAERNGRIAAIETIKVDSEYKLGIGTAVGAVAGGLLGSQVGSGSGARAATVAGAAVGAAAGTVAESKLKQQDAHRITVRMDTGGQVTVVQPVNVHFGVGSYVRVEGSGETARVVPR